jgi:hypothetical protein
MQFRAWADPASVTLGELSRRAAATAMLIEVE